jgi:spore maturation protein CgeB
MTNFSILYYFPEINSVMYEWQRFHFINELKSNKINIDIFNPLHYQNIEVAQEELLKFLIINKNKYSLFFTGVNDTLITPEVILRIKEIGIPTLLICFDNLHAPFIHKNIAPFFDLVWLTSSETEYIFKGWGANTIFLPYAANPFFFRPSMKPDTNSVGFIGTPYGMRLQKIKSLTAQNIPVAIYSNSFFETQNQNEKVRRTISEKTKHATNLISFHIGRKILFSEFIYLFQHSLKTQIKLTENKEIQLFPSVSFNEMVELYSSFAISLGITDVRNTYLLKKPVLKLHLRTFEIPMCGGLQIINYTDEIASYFEDEKEIILYKSENELIDKTKFYLQDSQDSVRKRMKNAARKRAESDHTWIKRFRVVFNKLNI